MLYLENHDHPRIVSRYGSEQFRSESAKMLATALLFQQGTPFIYQGQEIGMTNWRPKDASQYRDVQTIYNYEHSALKKTEQQRLERLWKCSRDNSRTPVQWSSEKNAGFTTADTTWMSVNPNYPMINVADQEKDPDSVLNFYRQAIRLRKELSCVRHGVYREHQKHSGKLYLYSMQDDRQKILVVCSFSKKNEKWQAPKGFCLDGAELILGNYKTTVDSILQPYECRVYLWK